MRLFKEHALQLGQFKEKVGGLTKVVLSNQIWKNKLF